MSFWHNVSIQTGVTLAAFKRPLPWTARRENPGFSVQCRTFYIYTQLHLPYIITGQESFSTKLNNPAGSCAGNFDSSAPRNLKDK